MRSLIAIAALLLAGCGQAAPHPYPEAARQRFGLGRQSNDAERVVSGYYLSLQQIEIDAVG